MIYSTSSFIWTSIIWKKSQLSKEKSHRQGSNQQPLAPNRHTNHYARWALNASVIQTHLMVPICNDFFLLYSYVLYRTARIWSYQKNEDMLCHFLTGAHIHYVVLHACTCMYVHSSLAGTLNTYYTDILLGPSYLCDLANLQNPAHLHVLNIAHMFKICE